jgi:hypothetical protein
METTLQIEDVELVLLKLLKKENGYYRVILELTKNEKEKLLKQRPFQEFHQLLKKKNIIFSCIEEIELELTPIKEYWKEYKTFKTSLSAEIEVILRKLEILLKEILEVDQENQGLLKKYIAILKASSNSKT